MNKTILGVDYRHVLPTAYITVKGRTQRSAEQNAKKVVSVLRQVLPPTAIISSLRDIGPGGDNYVIEIPIMIGECVEEAKAAIATLVLKGAA